jgi:hypothetical protein
MVVLNQNVKSSRSNNSVFEEGVELLLNSGRPRRMT